MLPEQARKPHPMAYVYTRSERTIDLSDDKRLIRRSCVCVLTEAKVPSDVKTSIKAAGVQYREMKGLIFLCASYNSCCLKEAVETLRNHFDVEFTAIDEDALQNMLTFSEYQDLLFAMDAMLHPAMKSSTQKGELNVSDLD